MWYHLRGSWDRQSGCLYNIASAVDPFLAEPTNVPRHESTDIPTKIYLILPYIHLWGTQAGLAPSKSREEGPSAPLFCTLSPKPAAAQLEPKFAPCAHRTGPLSLRPQPSPHPSCHSHCPILPQLPPSPPSTCSLNLPNDSFKKKKKELLSSSISIKIKNTGDTTSWELISPGVPALQACQQLSSVPYPAVASREPCSRRQRCDGPKQGWGGADGDGRESARLVQTSKVLCAIDTRHMYGLEFKREI